MGPFACHCLQLPEEDLRAAVRRYRLCDLAGLMARSEAGTSCTACHPDLRRLVREERERAAYFPPSPICSAR